MILAFIPYIVLCAIHRDTPPGLPLIHERAGAILLYFSAQFVMFIPHVFMAICILMYLYFSYFSFQLLTRIGSLFVSLITLAFAEPITGVSVSEASPTILELHHQWVND